MEPSQKLGQRVQAFDWLRGLAVVVMVQCHAMDLLLPELRTTALYLWLRKQDGLVAPAFIFAAGFSLALVQVRSAASGGPRWPRLRKTLRRIAEVLLVATLVNWAWFPIFREPHWLIRIDILHCIGLSLLLALPVLFGLARRPTVLQWASLLLALTVFAISPLFEQTTGWLGYFINSTKGYEGATFPLLPWAGYVFLGASAGAAAAGESVKALVRWLLFILAIGAVLWFFMNELFAAYGPHTPWVTNPANAAWRWVRVMVGLLGLIAVEQLIPQAAAWRVFTVLRGFGQSSLAGYFFHQMLLYYRLFGVLSFYRFFGQACGWPVYWLLTGCLLALTYGLVKVNDRLYAWAEKRWLRRAS